MEMPDNLIMAEKPDTYMHQLSLRYQIISSATTETSDTFTFSKSCNEVFQISHYAKNSVCDIFVAITSQ